MHLLLHLPFPPLSPPSPSSIPPFQNPFMHPQAFLSPAPFTQPNRSSALNSPCPLRQTTFVRTESLRPTLRRPRHTSDTPLHISHRPSTMALSNVVIAGGTGFIGTRITQILQSQGTKVHVLTRSIGPTLPTGAHPVSWTPSHPSDNEWYPVLANADLIINLAGHSVVSRWDQRGREAITSSRVDSTSALVRAITSLPPEQRPRAFVSASASGYYGFSETAQFDETSSLAQGFLPSVCQKWEAEADKLSVPETRLVKIRIGVVMGIGGGALASMLPPFQFFLGGPVGTGRQWVPWIHVDDLARVFIRAGELQSMTGVYNAAAPHPVTMTQLADSLGRALGRPSLFPVPEFVLKLVYGEAASVVLQGCRMLPNRLLQGGFEFRYPGIDDCMKAIADELQS